MKAGDPRKLTHVDEAGAARMVDVGDKAVTKRVAVAECLVRMSREAIRTIRNSDLAKGDALGVARVAGIMGAKRTSELIPLCHPLPISSVEIAFEFQEGGLRIEVKVRVTGKTGVEMEALTSAAVAGLTIIDMVKAIDKGTYLEGVRLLSKTGGKSGDWVRDSR